MSPDLRGILDEVIASPDDDMPRRIYADYMDDHGDHRLAAFIRWQLGDDATYTTIRPRKWFEPWWGDGVKASAYRCEQGDGVTGMRSLIVIGYSYKPRVRPGHMVVTRGFAHTASLPLESWRKHGPALARRHPLTRVEINDRMPGQVTHAYGPATWAVGEGDDSLPFWLCRHLDDSMSNFTRQYTDRKAANDALSMACLAWARAENEPVAFAAAR